MVLYNVVLVSAAQRESAVCTHIASSSRASLPAAHCKAGPGGHDGPPLLSLPPVGDVPNGRSLPDPGDQWQHTSPAKAAPPQPRRRTYQPATPRPGDLSEPLSINLTIPLQQTHISHLQHDPFADFLDLPRSCPGNPPKNASPLKSLLDTLLVSWSFT